MPATIPATVTSFQVICFGKNQVSFPIQVIVGFLCIRHFFQTGFAQAIIINGQGSPAFFIDLQLRAPAFADGRHMAAEGFATGGAVLLFHYRK
jgi:hypothetical protein